MLNYLVKRLVGLVPVLFGVSFLVFLTVQLAPGDVTTLLLGPLASEEAKSTLRQALGLDQPIVVQYVKWLNALLHGDFGTSIATSRKVLDLVLPRIGNTLILGGVSLVVTVVTGCAIGLAASANRGSLFDRLSVLTVLVLGNIPPFWLGLVLSLVFALQFRWFPISGMSSLNNGGGFRDVAWHLVLPAVTTAAAPAAVVTRMTRAAVLEVLGQDYIQVARAKGVPERRILLKHALRNALPPITTIIGLQLGYLLGGTLFSEVVFAWPGLGQLLYTSIVARDLPVIQAAVLAIALSFVLINLAADLANQMLDPRSRHG
ncbi:MAG TPA: ABC transporter permease [Xanthobacteraceae bacterium]|nr:ABC transporter permease [Xanthobacteraceae bacterium]